MLQKLGCCCIAKVRRFSAGIPDGLGYLHSGPPALSNNPYGGRTTGLKMGKKLRGAVCGRGCLKMASIAPTRGEFFRKPQGVCRLPISM